MFEISIGKGRAYLRIGSHVWTFRWTETTFFARGFSHTKTDY